MGLATHSPRGHTNPSQSLGFSCCCSCCVFCCWKNSKKADAVVTNNRRRSIVLIGQVICLCSAAMTTNPSKQQDAFAGLAQFEPKKNLSLDQQLVKSPSASTTPASLATNTRPLAQAEHTGNKIYPSNPAVRPAVAKTAADMSLAFADLMPTKLSSPAQSKQTLDSMIQKPLMPFSAVRANNNVAAMSLFQPGSLPTQSSVHNDQPLVSQSLKEVASVKTDTWGDFEFLAGPPATMNPTVKVPDSSRDGAEIMNVENTPPSSVSPRNAVRGVLASKPVQTKDAVNVTLSSLLPGHYQQVSFVRFSEDTNFEQHKPPKKRWSPTNLKEFNAKIAWIESMGFEIGDAKEALVLFRGNEDAALATLQEWKSTYEKTQKEELKAKKKQQKLELKPASSPESPSSRPESPQNVGKFAESIFKGAKGLMDISKKLLQKTFRSSEEGLVEQIVQPTAKVSAIRANSDPESATAISASNILPVEKAEELLIFNTAPEAVLPSPLIAFDDNVNPAAAVAATIDALFTSPYQNINTTKDDSKIIRSEADSGLTRVDKLREEGNELFKQGQFADAAQAYSKAIDILPPNHKIRAILLNNRSAAYLKTGQYRECIADCDFVQKFDNRNPKSLLRRASAYEALENWQCALDDYRLLMGLQPGPAVSSGMSRCQTALQPKPPSAEKVEKRNHANSNHIIPKSSAHTNSKVEAAVTLLRNQNLKDEKEADVKFAIKDRIDSQVIAINAGIGMVEREGRQYSSVDIFIRQPALGRSQVESC